MALAVPLLLAFPAHFDAECPRSDYIVQGADCEYIVSQFETPTMSTITLQALY